MHSGFTTFGAMEGVEELLKLISNRLDGIDEKLGKIVTDMNTIKLENKQLKEKVEKQDKRIEALEKEARKKNLVLKGVFDEEAEEQGELLEKIAVVMNNVGVEWEIERDLEDYIRLGKYREDGTRPILVKLSKYNKKIEILKQAKNLKNSEIWINEDFTKEVQEERRKLVPIMKEARRKGQKAILKYDKLIINNELYDKDGRDTAIIKQTQQRATDEPSGSTKRSVSDRSPKEDPLQAQLKKITKTAKPKN